jgi:hypothetical protein
VDLIRRPGAIAIARALNGAFFLAASAYCLLAYSPFAYNQFIKPNVVPALTDFVAVSPWLFWATLLLTTLTLMPQLRAGRAFARWYIGAGAFAGAIVMLRPPLAAVGNTWTALAIGLAALVSPIALALIDHAIWPRPRLGSVSPRLVLSASLVAAAIGWAAYAAAVPFRIPQAIGIDLPLRSAVAGAGVSFVLHLAVFAAIFVLILAVTRAAAAAGAGPAGEFWSISALLWIGTTLVLDRLVCASLAFAGRDAWIASASFAAAFVAIWMDVGRLRMSGQPADVRGQAVLNPLDAIAAPIAGRRTSVVAVFVALALPLIAYALAGAVRQFDWNFLLQKLGVLMVWLVALACAIGIVRSRCQTPRQADRVSDTKWLGFLAIVSLVIGFVAMRAAPASLIDRYAAVDPAFRLMRDAQTLQSSETVEYYAYLRSHTLLPPPQVPATTFDFVQPLVPVERPPHIFLLIVDSLRRDYVFPYNPRVTFTPQIAALAAESDVFENAFTRYAGTALAVPSIWAGAMLPHVLDQPPDFLSRNTLLKLLVVNGYRRIMDLDHIVKELVPRDASLEELDRGKGTMDVDVCGTTTELEGKLQKDRGRPAFFYSLPQNVHIAVAAKRPVPAGESYPAEFFDRTASSVRRVDACVGSFISFLKREGLYDNSIIVITADHGDSLGEEGRWGHAYFIYPEVMRVPLIVHVPSRIRAAVHTDHSAVVFSTDIAPSLYALLGYEPQSPGSLVGQSFFVRDQAEASRRRSGSFLVASSYGAVYGMLRDNGRQLYVVDAVDGSDYAFDLSNGNGVKVTVTRATTEANRALIREQLDALAALYRYHPQR